MSVNNDLHRPEPTDQFLSGYARLKELVGRSYKIFWLSDESFLPNDIGKTPSDGLCAKIEVQIVTHTDNEINEVSLVFTCAAPLIVKVSDSQTPASCQAKKCNK